MDAAKIDGGGIYQKVEIHGKMIKIKALYMRIIFCLLLKFMA